jgi:hypothetical protein
LLRLRLQLLLMRMQSKHTVHHTPLLLQRLGGLLQLCMSKLQLML